MNIISKTNTKLKNFICICIALIVFVAFGHMSDTVMAAETANISVSSASASVGDEVSIKVSITTSGQQTAGYIKLTYDTNVVDYVSGGTGGGGTVILYTAGESSVTVKFKAKAAGSSSIIVAEAIVGVGEEDNATVTKSNGSIRVNAPANYSSDNTLKSLSISPGVLSPAFSSSVTEYTTSVGSDCASLTVSAVANDSKAKVSVSGKRMDPGKNTTTITVTAENGSTKVYKIYTTKEVAAQEQTTAAEPEKTTESQEDSSEEETTVNENNLTGQTDKIMVDGKAFTIISDLTAHPLPAGYEKISYDYNGLEITAGKGTNNKLILIYLENTDGNGTSGFYIYDSVTKEFTPYVEIGQPTITYVILPITDNMEKPDGYTLEKYNIGGNDVNVLMDPSKTFCLFYGVDSNGVAGWFRYDCKDCTIQAYIGGDSQSATAVVQEVNNDSLKIWQLATIILAVVCVLLIVAVIMLAANKNKHKDMLINVLKDGDEPEGGSASDEGDILEDVLIDSGDSGDEDDSEDEGELDNEYEPDDEDYFDDEYDKIEFIDIDEDDLEEKK